MKVVKKIDSISLKLKQLMKAVKELGGSFEEELKAKNIFKNYFKQTKVDE